MSTSSIVFYKRFWPKGGRTGKYSFNIPDPMYIISVCFNPFYEENGEKKVTITRVIWEQKNKKWESRIDTQKVVTPNEANALYLKVKNTPYVTRKVPDEFKSVVHS